MAYAQEILLLLPKENAPLPNLQNATTSISFANELL